MITTRVTTRGLEVAVQRLDALGKRMTDVRPAAPDVLAVFQRIAATAVQTEGASTASGAWAPLAPSTIADRLRKGFAAGPILQRTGALLRAVTQEATVLAFPNRLTLRVGGDAKTRQVFRVHQSLIGRSGVLPRRPIFALTSQDRRDLQRPIRVWITRGVAEGVQ